MTGRLTGLRFHHLGLAVREPEPALRFLQSLGYGIGRWICDDLQKVNLMMCRSATMPDVEVICRVGETGPLDSILSRVESLIYHVCYEVDDLEAVLEDLRGQGHRLRCVESRKPALLFAGRQVSFYYVQGFGLIEMLER